MTAADLVRRLKANDDGAHALDKTTNAIKQMQFRALRSLAQFLQEHDECFTEDRSTYAHP